MSVRAIHPRVGKAAHNARPVESELGWLSPVRKSIGDPRMWFLRCRCGEVVIKELNNVRSAVKRGTVPKCGKDCTHSEPG